ncbi:hypothetical protein [Pigmentiphaga sp.]|uniref:hypothetical protein n=1 Tax=Pigmentiphaga sp. TaxID=1977564 RepID=UPI0025EBF8B0|nr:hypothetical protein [Pigmentiphaga sp.]
MNVHSVSGAGGAYNTPSAGAMHEYGDKVGKMETRDLVKELGKNLEPWQRDMVERELLNRTKGTDQAQGSGGAQGAGGTGGDEDELKKLLKKLMDGTISAEEMQKLAGMMGVKTEDLEAVKGKGKNGGGGEGGQNVDIQGG